MPPLHGATADRHGNGSTAAAADSSKQQSLKRYDVTAVVLEPMDSGCFVAPTTYSEEAAASGGLVTSADV